MIIASPHPTTFKIFITLFVEEGLSVVLTRDNTLANTRPPSPCLATRFEKI